MLGHALLPYPAVLWRPWVTQPQGELPGCATFAPPQMLFVTVGCSLWPGPSSGAWTHDP